MAMKRRRGERRYRRARAVHRLLAVAVACCFAALLPVSAVDDVAYDVLDLSLAGRCENLVVVDLDGDGRRDLVVVRDGRFEVVLQDVAKGFDPSASPIVLSVPGVAVGWDIADLAGYGKPSVVALVDGRQVRAWTFDASSRGFGPGVVLLDGLKASLPRGMHHLALVRRIDADVGGDLVVPGAGELQIWRRQPGGGYGSLLRVPADFRATTTLDAEDDLTDHVGQSVFMPFFELRDFDGDGRSDLISETEDRYEVFRTGGDGALASRPWVSLDLAARRERLGDNDPESLNLSNLTEAFARTVQVVTGDVDGDGGDEVFVREGGRVTFFGGGKQLDASRPRQILKASGNVVFAGLFDEDGDGKRDLWIVRLEAVSIGDVFLWLVASGSLDVDVFVYRFEGERFARRPSRRLKVTVRFPSLPKLVEKGRAVDAERDRETASKPVAVRADLAGRGEARDVVVLGAGRAAAYLDKAGEPGTGGAEELLEFLDYGPDKDDYEIDLHNLDDLARLAAVDLAETVDGLTPDYAIPIAGLAGRPGVFIVELNGDDRDDLIVIDERSDAGVRGRVLRSR